MWDKILFLFDIDGTLIKINYVGKIAFSNSLYKTFNKCDLLKDISLAGRSDLATFKNVIENKNIKLSKNFNYYWRKFQNYFEEELKNISDNYRWEKIAKVDKILNIILENGGKLGLITGNMKKGAMIKLKKVNLNNLFPIGGFGNESTSRKKIAKNALRRARDYYKQSFEKIIVIGDTPLDIKAGNYLKANTVAIAGGSYTMKDLRKYNADITVKNYNDLLKSNFWACI